MTGKEAYESSIQFWCKLGFSETSAGPPWEALAATAKQRWEEIAFEQEQKERKDAQ